MEHRTGAAAAGCAENAVGAVQCGQDAGGSLGIAQKFGTVQLLAILMGGYQEIIAGIEESQHLQIGDVFFFLNSAIRRQESLAQGGILVPVDAAQSHGFGSCFAGQLVHTGAFCVAQLVVHSPQGFVLRHQKNAFITPQLQMGVGILHHCGADAFAPMGLFHSHGIDVK